MCLEPKNRQQGRLMSEQCGQDFIKAEGVRGLNLTVEKIDSHCILVRVR